MQCTVKIGIEEEVQEVFKKTTEMKESKNYWKWYK